jgi:hypothetical protein
VQRAVEELWRQEPGVVLFLLAVGRREQGIAAHSPDMAYFWVLVLLRLDDRQGMVIAAGVPH